MNVVTCSKEQFDWAVGVLDKALAGEEVDANEAFKAGAVLSVVGEAAFSLAEEVERLSASARALAALWEAARPVIEQAELDAATRSPYGLGAQFDFYEVSLTGQQVDALRAALAESETK